MSATIHHTANGYIIQAPGTGERYERATLADTMRMCRYMGWNSPVLVMEV